ncbi:MAG: ClpXP protease specificity-enhancing factor, partial [Pseudomonadota bacterium]
QPYRSRTRNAHMTPNRPYLIRAFFDWILDNDLTPHLLINAAHEGTVVPTQFVKDGQIVMNVSPSAVRDLNLGNEEISFSARFAGAPMAVHVPPDAVLGIYARENGRGMLFPEDDQEGGPPDDDTPKPPSRPSLKVVK